MSKILVVRKPDRTIHQVPVESKARLMSFNNRLPNEQKWSFEEMSKEEADKLPFFDDSFVTAGEAVSKVKKLESASAEKDDIIAELKAQLKESKKSAKKETSDDEKVHAAPTKDSIK